MDSPLNLQWKSLCFDGNFFFKIALKIIVQFLPFWWLFKNVSFCQPYEKVHFLKKRIFLEPWDQKKWISHSIYHRNHCVLGKKFFFKFFEKIGQNYAWFGQKSDKIRKMISKPLAQFSSKKFDYCLNLVYKHILFEKGGHMGVFKVFGA